MAFDLLPLHHYRNVIFDIDGTLVDSNDAHAHSFIDAFEQHGIHHIIFSDIRKLIGMNGRDILSHVLEKHVFTEKWQQIDQDRVRIFEERYLDHIAPVPDALPLIELMKAKGLRIALSSASPQKIVDIFIDRLMIRRLIEGATTSDDVPMGKPNPIAIEVCCEKFGFVPPETLMIGDSPYDVIAAHEYSIQTIGVLTGGYSREELLKTGAISVYENLNEIYQSYQQTVLNQ